MRQKQQKRRNHLGLQTLSTWSAFLIGVFKSTRPDSLGFVDSLHDG